MLEVIAVTEAILVWLSILLNNIHEAGKPANRVKISSCLRSDFIIWFYCRSMTFLIKAKCYSNYYVNFNEEWNESL